LYDEQRARCRKERDCTPHDQQRGRFPYYKEEEKERDCSLFDEQRARFLEPQGRGKGERLYSAL
jgi:hypothetical protein